MNRYIKNYIIPIVSDKQRKSFLKIIKEMTLFSLKKKTLPLPYFTRLLYKKDRSNYLDYISNKTVYRLQNLLNDAGFIPILENKFLFHLFYKGYKDIPVPNTLAFNIKNRFFVDGNEIIVNNKKEMTNILTSLYNRCTVQNSIFMKTLTGAWGKGAEKFNIEDFQNDTFVENLFQKVSNENYIFQETIIQHEQIDILYPYSVNSIRIDTYKDERGKAEIMSAFFRVGANKSVVDNVSLGGFFISIDLGKGILKGPGLSLIYNGAPKTELHPDTQIKFDGFELPCFEEVKTLVVRAAEKLPGVRLVGWDVVLSENGPILLEGNHDYHMGVLDIAYSGYHNNPVFKKMIIENGMELEKA